MKVIEPPRRKAERRRSFGSGSWRSSNRKKVSQMRLGRSPMSPRIKERAILLLIVAWTDDRGYVHKSLR